MAMQIYNVLTGKKEPFEPVAQGEVRIYVCGVTVYDRCHVGHLRCYLSFDAILRYFEHKGFRLKYVRNFTDIDDKIIARANEIAAGPDGDWRNAPQYESCGAEQWKARFEEDEKIKNKAAGGNRHLAEVVADHYIDVFRKEDFERFGLLQPMSEPRVSERIPQVIDLVQKIIERGFAYEVDGDVYFDVPAYHEATKAYGRLSGRDYTQLVEGARVAPTERKRSAPDFALWKRSKPGEPAWDSPWGRGRPGWHIECSAMSLHELGQPFDIHGGGKDLIFPHHENEIAQAEAATGRSFCNFWMHNGFVTVNGVKMSKSLGNFVSICEALDLAPPEVWRTIVLGSHYANPIDFSLTAQCGEVESQAARGTIDIAFERLEYFYETLRKADDLLAQRGMAPEGSKADARASEILERFEEVMDDDFNTAAAMAVIGDGMKLLNELCDMNKKSIAAFQGGKACWLASIERAAADLRTAGKALGLFFRQPAEALEELRDFAVRYAKLDCAAIEAKVAQREEARKARDWARADALRAELAEMKVEVRDTPEGSTWKVTR